MIHEQEIAQEQFLQAGGSAQRALIAKWKTGEMKHGYEYREYPKLVRISRGFQDIECSTETIKGSTVSWVEHREIFDEITVHSEDEEERVLAGGKPSAALEEERQSLINRCRANGIKVDVSWSTIRLRRELGEKLDAPEPKDDMATLRTKLEQLEEMAAMKAKIAALEAQVMRPADDADDLRQELAGLGITADKRWGLARLREELDKATANG